MKFLVDAHLPRRLAHWLRDAGHDVIHTSELPLGNRTSDTIICELSIREGRVVITKDEDFVDSLILSQTPYKPLLISTGNIKNSPLETLFQQNMDQIATAFDQYDFVELDTTSLTFHL